VKAGDEQFQTLGSMQRGRADGGMRVFVFVLVRRSRARARFQRHILLSMETMRTTIALAVATVCGSTRACGLRLREPKELVSGPQAV
jgi:hypothetical protein